MPRDDNTPICGSSKISCYDDAEDELIQAQYVHGIAGKKYSENECDCLPSCTSIRYDAEISQAPFDWDRLKAAFNTTEQPG